MIVSSNLAFSDDNPLIESMKNQLRNIEEVSVLPLNKFCAECAKDKYDKTRSRRESREASEGQARPRSGQDLPGTGSK